MRLAALLAALCVPAALPAKSGWLRQRSSHFELFTDAGEKSGREALGRLERVRRIFDEAIGGKATPLPIRVFLFASEREFREFRGDNFSKGFYQGGPERDYIVLPASTGETWRILNHEYVHLVLHHSAASLPQWLEEGTAEFYSTLQTRKENVILGAVIEGHVRALLRAAWLDARTFAQVTKDSPHASEEGKAGIFYAQSWALVHMLNSAPQYRKLMPRFAQLLDQSVPASLAFEQAFGRSLEVAFRDLRDYVEKRQFAIAEVYGAKEEAVEVKSEQIQGETADLALAELLENVGRTEEAGKMLASADASSPEVQTALGLWALQSKDTEKAKGHFRKAMASGRASALTYFEYAMLLRDGGGSREDVQRNLQEAVGRNPNLAEAQFLLGLMAQQDNRHREAIRLFEDAARVLPRQSYFWHALAMSWHALGDEDRARRAALKAADSAGSKEQREMAMAALRLVAAPAVAQVPRKPEVTIPESWKSKAGDSHVEGVLEQVDCVGTSARFHIRVEGNPVALWVEKPGEVLLKSESGITFTFTCGPQKARRVAVEYKSMEDAGRRTAGVITAIEFR